MLYSKGLLRLHCKHTVEGTGSPPVCMYLVAVTQVCVVQPPGKSVYSLCLCIFRTIAPVTDTSAHDLGILTM